MSLRLRLTAWYSGMLAITLLILGAVVYLILSRNLHSQLDQALAAQANEVVNLVQVRPAPLRTQRVILPDVNVFAAQDTYVQVIDLDEQIVARSENLGREALPVTTTGLTAARSTAAQYQTVRVGDQTLRTYTVPLVIEGHTIGWIQVARGQQLIEDTLKRLRAVLLGGSAFGVLIAMGVGWLMARAALRPVERIADAAEAIGHTQRFDRRVHQDGPADEVGRLARAFNTMLERLQAAYQQLEETLQAQRRFVADASHELRTPLTILRGNLGLLQHMNGASPADQAEALRDATEEAERMSRLVGALLTLARADTGQTIERHVLPLRPIVEDAFRQARLLSSGTHMVLGPVRDAWVDGNPDYLRQLLLILLDNALKYTPEGGTVSVGMAESDDTVSLWVRDTGIGISTEDQAHIFERFYRADRSRQRGGTGLGLSIAQWIVQEHHGQIALKSDVGKGSTFTVHLPRVTPPEGYGAGDSQETLNMVSSTS